MRKTTFFFLLFFICFGGAIYGQCLIPPPIPPASTGTEPLLADNETVSGGTSKWYYGSPAIMNSLTMKGGVLTVCNDLTIDKFYMDSGTIYVRPGVRFIIGSGIGAGLILDGNCAIYNYGFCEIQRNLSFGNANVSASKPNIVINALSTSVFRTANQYFVINSPHSYFVNNGAAEFWGIITDALSTPGCVCLGQSSTTRMAVLINKVANTYTVPTGNACVNVYQLSQFNNRLTNHPNLYVCLGSGHSSYSGCGGCPANNWGSAQVFTGCVNCVSLGVLAVSFHEFMGVNNGKENLLSWELENGERNGIFKIMKSKDGKDFSAIDSFAINTQNSSTNYNRTDKTPSKGDNYYMINYTHLQSGQNINSKPIKILANTGNEFSIFPIPFDHNFNVNYPEGSNPERIILTDITGRNLAIRYIIRPNSNTIEVVVTGSLAPGIYIVHIKTEKQSIAKTILKK